MPTNSGWLLEQLHPDRGGFEMFGVCSAPASGLVHLSCDAVVPFTWPEVWRETSRIRSAGFPGPFIGAAMCRTSYGHLEIVVAGRSGALAHFWEAEPGGWRGPALLPGKAAGAPAFVQSSIGYPPGNFEVIVTRPGGGLSHFFRANDQGANVQWQEGAQPSTTGIWLGVALVFSTAGRLEVAGVRRNGNSADLVALSRNDAGVWTQTAVAVAAGVSGRPAMAQTTYGGDFDLVVPLRDGGLRHYWRTAAGPWRPAANGADFGSGDVRFDDVTLLESSRGSLEAMARQIGGFRPYRRFRRLAPNVLWDGPAEGPLFTGDR